MTPTQLSALLVELLALPQDRHLVAKLIRLFDADARLRDRSSMPFWA